MKDFSLSKINLFYDCSFRWFGHYILKIRHSKNPVYFVAGHSLEMVAIAKLLNPEKSDEELEEILQDKWFEEYGFDQDKWEDEEKEKFEVCKKAIPVVSQEMVPEIRKHWTGNTDDIQKQFYIPLGDNFEFTGIIDVIGKNGVIIDIKTTSRTWPKGKELQEEQAKVYPIWAFSEDFDLEECHFYYYIIVLNKTPKLDVREVITKREDVENYLSIIEARSHIIHDIFRKYEKTNSFKIFPPNPQSWTCSRKDCPIWEKCQETWGITIKE